MVEHALFEIDGNRFIPGELTRGPWRPDAQHGGPPAALLAYLSEAEVEPGEFLGHIEVELVRPIPLSPLIGSVDRSRVSGRVARVHAELHCETELVARSTALVLAGSDLPPADWNDRSSPAVDPPQSDRAVEAPRWATGQLTTYHRNGVEHRFTAGTFAEAGPAVDWIRLRQPVVCGIEPSGLVRTVAAADFGSGISAVYGPASPFGLINANLAVSLNRSPEGDWISLDAQTSVGPQGTGLCLTKLGDHIGPVGVGTQTLLGYSMKLD